MRVNQFTKSLILLFSALLAQAADANDGSLVILSASDAPAYHRTTDRLTTRLREYGHRPRHHILSKERINPALHQAMIKASHVIAIGSKACDYAAKHSTSANITCGFITDNSFHTIHTQAPGRQNLAAIYIDQPLQRLINLASLLNRQEQPYQVGLLSPNTQTNRSIIAAYEAEYQDLKINRAELQIADNPVKVIEPMIIDSDVLIVQPSAKLFNRLVAQLILQLSLRYKVPVIGFSQKYAEAGALISLYASPEDIGEDLAEWLLNSDMEKPQIPTTQHGRHFSISVNRNVARKLKTAIDVNILEHQLEAMEGSTSASPPAR